MSLPFLCGCIGRCMFCLNFSNCSLNHSAMGFRSMARTNLVPAVVCLHGLYSVLQGFDGFLVVGYLSAQGGVLPFQLFDLVAAEKRTYAFGDVGGCGRGCSFQFLGLYLFFRPSQFLPCRFFLLLQIHHLRFEVVGKFLYIPIILLRSLGKKSLYPLQY